MELNRSLGDKWAEVFSALEGAWVYPVGDSIFGIQSVIFRTVLKGGPVGSRSVTGGRGSRDVEVTRNLESKKDRGGVGGDRSWSGAGAGGLMGVEPSPGGCALLVCRAAAPQASLELRGGEVECLEETAKQSWLMMRVELSSNREHPQTDRQTYSYTNNVHARYGREVVSASVFRNDTVQGSRTW